MTLTTRRVAIVAALAIGGVVAAALVGIGRPEEANGQAASGGAGEGITVTGTGSVRATPDTADFSFGVETQGSTSSEALEANSAAAEELIAAIRATGVESADIQTQQVSVSPRYSQDGREIVGYTATNSVDVTVRDLSKAGAVVEAAVAAGANQVYGPSFAVSSQDRLYEDALAAALDEARGKAEAIAADAGLALGPITGIAESGGSGAPVPLAEAAVSDASVPIEPGEQEIVATLTVTFAIS